MKKSEAAKQKERVESVARAEEMAWAEVEFKERVADWDCLEIGHGMQGALLGIIEARVEAAEHAARAADQARESDFGRALKYGRAIGLQSLLRELKAVEAHDEFER